MFYGHTRQFAFGIQVDRDVFIDLTGFAHNVIRQFDESGVRVFKVFITRRRLSASRV